MTTQDKTKRQITTLNPAAYRCNDCGEPSMVKEGGFLSCPECYLKILGKKIKGLDHAGYYP